MCWLEPLLKQIVLKVTASFILAGLSTKVFWLADQWGPVSHIDTLTHFNQTEPLMIFAIRMTMYFENISIKLFGNLIRNIKMISGFRVCDLDLVGFSKNAS